MTTEPRTETQHLEQRITNALTTIRHEWPHMLPIGPPPVRTGTGQTARITAPDHATTGTDIDPNTRLVSLRREVTDTLNGWTRVVTEDRPVTKALPDARSAVSMSTFLNRHAQWMSGHTAAEDMAGEVEALARSVKAITQPQRREWMNLGTCPLPTHDGTPCGGTIRAWPTPWNNPTPAEEHLPTCRTCGTEATVQWWYDRMNPTPNTPITTDQLIGVIAIRLGRTITHNQIRQWRHRGKITPAGRDNKGRTLYHHQHVIDAITTQDPPGANL